MNDFSLVISRICQELDVLVSKARATLNGTPESIVSRSTLQDGLFGELGIFFTNTVNPELMQLKLSFSSSDHEVTIPCIEHLTTQTMPTFKQALAAGIVSWLKPQENDPFWAHTVSVQFKYPAQYGVPTETNSLLITISNETRKTALRATIADYIEKSIMQGKYPPKELDIFFLIPHLVSYELYPEMDYAFIHHVVKQILVKISKKHYRSFTIQLLYSLNKWAENEFLPKYYHLEEPWLNRSDLFFSLKPDLDIGERNEVAFDEKDQDAVELLVYIAQLILQNEASYSRDRGIEHLGYAAELGYKRAKTILKLGSGLLPTELISLNNENLQCIANDVMATVTIKIKQETAPAYEQALVFLSKLFPAGFPRSYCIKFSSKVKAKFLVNKIGKSKTQQFFANAAQYPEVYPALATYAKAAMAEYEWYTDAEAEDCAMPSSYAVFILAMADKDYYPLLAKYLKTLDDEHQSVHQQFLKTWLLRDGITKANAALVVDCMLRVNGCFKAKIPHVFASKPALELLLAHSVKVSKNRYDVIILFIWGSINAFKKAITEAGPEIKTLLEQVEQRYS
ncbi:DUF6138 family protein [Pseudomonas sp. F1_0610]|uniref:DUF6138 family protein n=1 Tax=Pseudomonas sp. F1_0610 TaxID=3114284 RepID=UPI0039C42F71